MALQNSIGDFNTVLGASAGTDPGILSNNIYISDAGVDGDNNFIAIGNVPASGTPYEAMDVGGVVGAALPHRGSSSCVHRPEYRAIRHGTDGG